MPVMAVDLILDNYSLIVLTSLHREFAYAVSYLAWSIMDFWASIVLRVTLIWFWAWWIFERRSSISFYIDYY